ncbi:unnamed protein product [Mycena citricolor]|uniref:Uncharacterized protein n=1 Tax=Mycena citricolor TaxID=2018698 RepID=A0AAD2K6X8_9AGAR|nr:unnamed protein product [Mycena citricolor]
MFSKLFTVALGALSFITDSAVPSWRNNPQQPQGLTELRASLVAPIYQPKPGTYRIQPSNYGYAEIHTYNVGQPLFVSLGREYPGLYSSFELVLLDGSSHVFGLKNIGQNSNVVVDGDNTFVTTTDGDFPQGFTMERTETEGYFLVRMNLAGQGKDELNNRKVRTTDGSNRVWTLNPDEGPIAPRIMLAPATDAELSDSQRFQFVPASSDDVSRVVGHSAKFPCQSKSISSASPIAPGRYRIIDSYVLSWLRSYVEGEDMYTGIDIDFPADFGVWDVAGDDESGYTVTNVGQNLPLSLTPSKTLSPNSGATPAKFNFTARAGDSRRIVVALTTGEGVWQVDLSQSPLRAPIKIEPQDNNVLVQEFNFLSD